MTTLEIFHLFCDLAIMLSTFGLFAAARRPQKNQVSFDFVPAAKEDFDKHVAWDLEEHRILNSRIGDHLSALNAVDRKVASVETANQLQNQTLAQISAKIDRLVERQ